MINTAKISACACFIFLSLPAIRAEGPGQRMVIFLKDPIESKTVNVKIDKNLETATPFEEKKEGNEKIYEFNHKIILERGRANRYALTLDLIQSGYVKLEIRDFGGKKIGVLFEDYLSKGKYVFEENEAWEGFNNLKGIAFISLYVDGKQALKKLIAKMD